MNRISCIIFLVLLAGCARQPQPVELGARYILQQDSEKDGVARYSLTKTGEGPNRLVSEFMVEDDTVVSLAPTPVSSDVARPTAEFVFFGNALSSPVSLYLNEHGKLFHVGQVPTEPNEQAVVVKHTALWKKSELRLETQNRIFSRIEGNVHLVVQQGAPFSRVRELLKALGENEKVAIGIGWDSAPF